MSNPSSKYDKAGWKKYEFPPDMITAEQNEKKMKLSWPQIKRLMAKQIESRIYSSSQSGDVVTASEWKAFSVRMQAKDMTQRINEEFIQDFIKWLTGRSVFNSTKYFEVVADERGVAVSKEITGGCPWGNTPLTNLPGVSEFLDQGIDRRSKVIDYIAKLKLRGPRNLDEAYMYYKYILRKVAVDDDACFEVQEMADFDYPVDPDTGKVTGPAVLDTPPLFNELKYTSNFLLVYSLTMQNPELTAEWIMNGATAMDLEKLGVEIQKIPVNEIDSWLNSIDYDLVYRDGRYKYVKDWLEEGFEIGGPDTYIERERIAREEIRGRERRRKLRKAGRAPSAKMATGATAKKGADLSGVLLGPDGRQKSRRLARREARRDDRIEDDRENLAQALEQEYFGTKNYVSFWALSGSDQDYIMAMLLAQNAFSSALQVLQSPASTGAAGGPVSFPEARKNEPKYAFPGDKTEKMDKDTGSISERLKEMARKISGLPGATSDPAVAQYLKSILKTVDSMDKKMDRKQEINVYNKQPIHIDNSNLNTMIQANTAMLGTVKNLMISFGEKLKDFGNFPPRQPPPYPGMPPGMAEGLAKIDTKLSTLIDVLGGMPKVFAEAIPKPPRHPPPRGPDVPPKPPPPPPGAGKTKVESGDFGNPRDVIVQKGQVDAPDANIRIDHADKITNEYRLGDVTVPMLFSMELAKHIAENLRGHMPNSINVQVDAEKIAVPNIAVYPQVFMSEELGAAIGQNIQFKSLEERIEKFLHERETARDNQAAIIGQQQTQINALYQELKGMQLVESTKLDQMKMMLDNMTTLQQAVAGIIAKDQKAANEIQLDMDLEEVPLKDKLQQTLDLSPDTIQKLLNGNYAGIQGLKEEIKVLTDTVFKSLNHVNNPDAPENARQVVTMAMMAKSLVEHSTNQSNMLQRIQTQYAPADMAPYLPSHVLTSMHNLLNDQNSVFGGRVKIAEITDDNVIKMKEKLEGLDAHLKLGNSEWKLQKDNIELLRKELENKINQVQAEAETYSKQQREAAYAEVVNLRNAYATKQAELTDMAQNYAAIAASHATLKDEFERFKNAPKPRRQDPSKGFEKALDKLFTTKLQPAIKKLGEDVASAIENSPIGLPDDRGAEADIQGEAGNSGIQAPPGSSIGVPPLHAFQPPQIQGQDVPIVQDPEALPQDPQYMAQEEHRRRFFGNAEPPAPVQVDVGPPTLFVSPAAVQARNALERLVDETLREKPYANAYTVLRNPIDAAIQTLSSRLPREKLGVDPTHLNPEERLTRNEMFLVNRYSDVVHQMGQAESDDSPFKQPLQYMTKERQYEVLSQAVNVLAKGDQDWQTPHNLERITKLITDYQGTLDSMRDKPTEQSHSVSAAEYIGKLNGSELRARTGYNNQEGNSVRPASSAELDGYITLSRVAREMIDVYNANQQDPFVYYKLRDTAMEYPPFKEVSFVTNSPLYQAIMKGTPQNVIHALSQDGTMHLDRNYYSQSVKLRTDMLYDAFKYAMYPYVEGETILEADTGNPEIDQRVEQADIAYESIGASGMSENALLSHQDFKDDVFNISSDETSIYLQAYLKAAILSSFTKSGMLEKENTTEEEAKAVGASLQGLNNNAYFALGEYAAISNEAATLIAQSGSDTARDVYESRKKTVDTLADKMYEAMTASITPEFQAISSRGSDAQKYWSVETADAATEAVDTLNGLGNSAVMARLKQKRSTYNTISSLPSARVMASQLKKAINMVEGPANKVLSEIVNIEMQKPEILKARADAVKKMRTLTPQLIDDTLLFRTQ